MPANHWAFEAIEWAASAGVTLGYGDGTFRPSVALGRWHALVVMERYYDDILQASESADFTRADMMVLLKAINDGTLRNPDTAEDTTTDTSSASGGQRFPDVPADHYAFEAIEWAASAGVTLGYGDGTFRPSAALGRWHALVFMERYYDDILQASESADFTRADMMVLLKAINDGTLRGTATFNAVSAGGRHSCAIATDNTITCWGDNRDGQANAPSGSYKAVSAGWSHSCAIAADDTITCWGENDAGQASAPSGSFKAVSAGAGHSCAIGNDDTITCWGWNDAGQTNAPFGSFKAVSASVSYSCGLRTDGVINCWGNDHGPGDGHEGPKFDMTATPYDPDDSYQAVSAAWFQICGLTTNGTIACWDEERGSSSHLLVDAPSGSFAAVSASTYHSCGLRTDGTIVCWSNYTWATADDGEVDAPSGTYKAVSAGEGHNCAIATDDTITCWGNNYSGQADAP